MIIEPSESSGIDFSNYQAKYCPKHGKQLEFFCFEDKQTICSECARQEHKTHKFNYINICAKINLENLEAYLRGASSLHIERKGIRKQLQTIKNEIRSEVLDIQLNATKSIEKICQNLLHSINTKEFTEIEFSLNKFQEQIANKIESTTKSIRGELD
jgi:hypothetical protein